MSCDAQIFLTRTATPTFTWFNGQTSHWTSTESARESALEIFTCPAEPPWKIGDEQHSCHVRLLAGSTGRVQIHSIHEDAYPSGRQSSIEPAAVFRLPHSRDGLAREEGKTGPQEELRFVNFEA